jgi:hypothetical protein
MKRIALFLAAFLLLVFSCGNTPAPVQTSQAAKPAVPDKPAVVPVVPDKPAEVPPAPAAPPVPAAKPTPVPPAAPAAETPPSVEDPFDPGSITQEVYDSTLNEVKAVIAELNKICSDAGKSASANASYNSWLTWLGTGYAEMTKDPATLARLSDQPGLKTRNIELKTQRDYFINVFAASRQNVKVDEIEFLTPQRVKVLGLEYEEKSMPSSRELQQVMLDQGYQVVRVRNQLKMTKTNKIRYYVLERISGQWKIASLDED